MSVKKGDVVVYSKYGGTEITVDGNELVILEEDQILAVKE
jgi:chaperonin GroES